MRKGSRESKVFEERLLAGGGFRAVVVDFGHRPWLGISLRSLILLPRAEIHSEANMDKKRNASGVPSSVDASGEPVTLGESNGFEIYPMPMFATLSVSDVAAMSEWYGKALGFGIVFQMPPVNGQPSLVHLRRGKYQDVLPVPATAGTGQPSSSLTLSFHAEDVDALAAQARAAGSVGVSAIQGPVDTPWNTRDLRVTDPAGHRLVFTSRQTNPDPARVERIKKLLDAGRKPQG
jgi:uncharacterized glyoxalase superfamily protein PhnB